MADTISVGVLRATLAADTAKWTMGLREAGSSLSALEKQAKSSTDSITRGMSAAGKAASDSTKLIAGMGAAGQQASAQIQAAMQDQAQKAAAWQQMLQRSASASAEAEKSFNQTAQAGSRAGQALLGVAAVLGTINFGAAAAEAATAASRIQDAAERMAISTDAVQRLGFAAEQSGASLESVATAMGRMAETLGSSDADKKLRSIGLSLEAIKGLSPDQTFITIAEAIRKIPDPLRQSDEATNMFGRSALQLLPAIRAGFKDVGDQAPLMSKSVIESGDRVGDKLNEIKLRMNNLKAEALLPFADFFTQHLPNSVQVGIAGLSSFIPSLEQLTLGVLAFGGPSGAWKAMVAGFSAISLAARGAVAAFWPLAAAIAAVWAAWKIGNTETVKNSIAVWALSADNLTAQLFRAVTGIDQMSEAQARASVSATAAAEKTRETAAATAEIDAAMAKAMAPVSGLTEKFSSLTQEQTKNTVATKAIVDASKEAAEAHREWARVVRANEKILEQQTKEAEKFFQQERKIAEASADAMLKSFNARTAADKEFTRISRKNEFERAEFAIEMAERQGASWQELYALERELSEARLHAAIQDAEEEFVERTRWIDRTTAFGEAEYQALRRVHDEHVRGMLDEHQRAEAIKRDELDQTFNVWRRAMDGIRELWRGLTTVISENLTQALLHAQSFKDAFVGIWQSIKQSILTILSDILNSFVKSFLDGMLGAIMGRQGAFGNAFAGLLGGGGPGGGLLGGLLGLGGGASALVGGTTAATAVASTAVPAAIFSGGASAGVGAAAAGGASGGMGAAMTALFTNPWTIGIAGAILGGLAIWKTGFGRGGEEGTQVNPARDAFFGGFQQQFGGSQFEALAQAFAASGVSGDIAEKLIADLYAADQMEEFRAATQAIQEALAAGANASVEAQKTAEMADKAIVQLNATLSKVEATGDVSEEAITALREAIASLKNSNVSAAAIEALNKTLNQMIAEGTASDEAILALTDQIAQMTETGGELQTQVEDTTTATGELDDAQFDLEQQLGYTGENTDYLSGRMEIASEAAASFAELIAQVRNQLAQPIEMPPIILPDIQLPNYVGGGGGGEAPPGGGGGGEEYYEPPPPLLDSYSWDSLFPSFANEGIVRNPTLAMIGDAAEPEYILHQGSVKGLMDRAFNMGASMLDSLTGGLDMGGTSVRSGGDTFNLTAQIRIDGAGKNGATLAQELVTELPRALRRNHELVRNLRTAVVT